MKEKWLLNFIGAVQVVALSVLTWLFGTLNAIFYSVLFLMLVDVNPACLSAVRNNDFSSSKMRSGLWKKVGTLLMITIVYRVDTLIPEFSGVVPVFNEWQTPMRDIFLGMFLVNDLVSITENLTEWGVPIPEIITQKLAQVNGKQSQKE